jgi:hypothetical protein
MQTGMRPRPLYPGMGERRPQSTEFVKMKLSRKGRKHERHRASRVFASGAGLSVREPAHNFVEFKFVQFV